MKIAIDARGMLYVNDPSWHQYCRRLVSGLQQVDPTNQYVLFFNFFRQRHKHILNSYRFNENFQIETLRIPQRFASYLFEDLHLPIDIVLGKVDLFHGPYFTLLHNAYGKSIVTIHDLIFIRVPEVVTPGWREFAKKRADYSIRRADAIVAVSEHTKGDIIDLYQIPEERIRVIYNGVGKEFFPTTQGLGDVKVKYGIKKPYLLCVSAIEPRKNLLALVQAFSHLRRFREKDYHLVVVGIKGYRFEEVFQKVRELELEQDVIFTGKVPDYELPVLYSGSDLFIFPSLSEGFGIPPLEAMACGTPVIASNVSPITEVVGDAALLVDPYCTSSIAEGMWTLLTDVKLRDRLIARGLERSRLFSWEKAATETVKLYQEL